MKNYIFRIISLILALLFSSSLLFTSAYARDGIFDGHVVGEWISREEQYGEFGSSGKVGGFGGGNRDNGFASNIPQNYYITCTSSTQDKYGNVTNYYRSGDTTNTKIIDSYNHTFNTIHNTTNNTTTNNYKANVRLSDFLNSYTTNNVTNKYTYSAEYNSWYYDNTQNILNYTDQDTFYSYDNSRYYISIDNSTDEYYLVDVQYSPTFVTVNYTYNTTNNKYDKEVGDVTNVYYYELKDGRNSSTLTASEVAGLDVGYDAANYELVTDDPNTLSLQHFDSDYSDSSSFNRSFYSENRSTNYVDSGAFGKAVSLPNGSAAGVTIPDLSSYSDLTFDFRIYYNDISKLGVYFGDTNIFQEVPTLRKWIIADIYDDDGKSIKSVDPRSVTYNYWHLSRDFSKGTYHFPDLSSYFVTAVSQYSTLTPVPLSNSFKIKADAPSSYYAVGYEPENSNKYGWMASGASQPSLYSSKSINDVHVSSTTRRTGDSGVYYVTYGTIEHRIEKEYRWTPDKYVLADFAYDSYKNQWVSMRITLSGGKIYYFVNGDLVGSGPFTKPTADKFYIKSSGTVYLDELRVTTGSLSSASTYNPATAPYDTNKALALPDTLIANTIYVQHNTPVSTCRVGGIRPSNPTNGFLYIPLHDDHTGAQPQLYTDGNWINVTAMVHNGDTTVTALGYKFSPVGSSPDVDVDLEPGRPDKPGQEVDPETCTHKWEETSRTDATCTTPGSVESTCSKCSKTKTEPLKKLGHTWEVKQSTQTTYDGDGNVLTQGFTIYRCTICGEEYKDTDGTGPPGSGSPSTPGEEEDKTLWDKIGELLGSAVNGLLSLFNTVLDKVLGGLIDLVTNLLEHLKELADLFGSFGEALGILWTWLPPEIMAVLVSGVTIFVFIALLKLFFK